MNFKSYLLSFCFVLCFFLSAQAQRTIIHAGTLIDGVSDEAQTEMSIIIENNMITAVEKGYTDPGTNDEVIDLKSKTVLPGLIDLHVHLESETNPQKYLEAFTFDEADLPFAPQLMPNEP